jgi:hypothetical protein
MIMAELSDGWSSGGDLYCSTGFSREMILAECYYTHTHTHTHTHTDTHREAHIYTCMHIHVCICLCKHIELNMKNNYADLFQELAYAIVRTGMSKIYRAV